MKNLKFIVLSFILMFCFNTNVLAIDCYYNSDDGSEIKVILQDNGLGDLYPNINSSSYNYAYPLNGIYKIKKNIWFDELNGGYIPSSSGGNRQEACPSVITNHYVNTPFDAFLIGKSDENNIEKTVYLVTYSEDAYTTNSTSPNAKFKQDMSSVNGDLRNCFSNENSSCSDIKILYSGTSGDIKDLTMHKKIYNLNKTKTFSNSGDSGNNNGYIECKYRNTKGTYVLFHFQKNEYTHKYWVGTSSITAAGEGQTSGNNAQLGYSTCPPTVYFPLGNSEKSTFITPTTCAAEEENCYYREDVDFTYSDNAEEIYPYVKFLASNESVYIKVLKTPDENGERVKAYLNNTKEIDMGMDQATKQLFINGQTDALPKYILKNGNTFTFSNTKVDGNEVYMYVAHLLQIVIDSDGEIEETCRNLLGDDFLNFLNDNVFKLIYIGVPILLIVLTSFDFAKVVFIDDKEGIQGAFKKFGKRAVAAVLIYFVPTILIFVVNLIGADDVEKCAQTIKNITEQQNSN